MTTTEIVNFETVPIIHGGNPVIGSYDGFTWTNAGVVTRGLLKGDPDGFDNVIHGKVVGCNDNGKSASFSSTTDFSLKSGIFAAAWDTGLHVKFIAYLNGVVVGTQSVVLDQAAEVIHFNTHFQHIDMVKIQTSGGTHGTGEGSGREIAMDNLKVVFDGSIPSAQAAHGALAALSEHSGLHNLASHDFQIAHIVHDWIGL